MTAIALLKTTKRLIIKKLLKRATILLKSSLIALVLTPAPSLAETGTTSDPGSDPRILPDLEQERLQALARSQLPDTQTLWLESQHESFLGLYRPANRPAPKGAILLLHHDRTSADWPGPIATLRHGLPDQGWHTLSLALPDEPEYIPPRIDEITLSGQDPAASTALPSPTTDEQPGSDKLQAYFDQISARIESGLTYLKQQQPASLLILGEGTGGYWALRFTVSQQDQHQLFPILIDTVAPATPTTPQLVELVAQLQRPTLDLYHGNGLKRQRIEVQALQRRDAARRQGHQLLTSRRLAPRAGDWRQQDKRLLGVMRGMLATRFAKPAKAQARTASQLPPN